MNTKNKKGFSLMEVLIAAFVLTVGIISVMALISGSIRNSADSRDTIIASELAQEGIEMIRFIRDNNSAKGCGAFNLFPSSTTSNLSNCRVDMNLTLSSECPVNYKDDVNHTSFGFNEYNCSATPGSIFYVLKYSDNGYYFYPPTGGAFTKFQRRITVAYDTPNPDSATKATIRSFVSWNGNVPNIDNCNLGNKCLYAEDVLTNWAD